jgi:hypothetical protein
MNGMFGCGKGPWRESSTATGFGAFADGRRYVRSLRPRRLEFRYLGALAPEPQRLISEAFTNMASKRDAASNRGRAILFSALLQE